MDESWKHVDAKKQFTELYIVIPFLYISKIYKTENSVLSGIHTYVMELL